MKKIIFYLIFALSIGKMYAQNYIFTNTGNFHTQPYGVMTWAWDTAAYKRFSYTSTTGGDNYTMPYRLLSPKNNNPAIKYPLFIMFHGAGEGIGNDCDISSNKNTCQLLWGGQIALDSSNKYPGYVFFPQTGGGYWGNNGADNGFYGFSDPMASPTRTVFEIIENILLTNYNIDPDRIYIAGLSAGGRATWEFLLRRPDLFAAATPFCGMGNPNLAKTVINNPIWNYQGGQDDNPNPFETQNMYDSIVKYGGNPKRSLYVDRDHWVWVDAYQSKTWMQWIYSQNKKNIHILYGKEPSICPDSSIKLGIGYNYLQYQWKKDGVSIPGANTYVQSVNQPGTYTVDFQRRSGGWVTSNPIVVTSKNCSATSDNGIKYSYYEGNYTSIPNLNVLTPKKTGVVTNYSLAPRDRELNYAFKFDAILDITTGGTYTFYTTSDDGSKLYINGKQVVFNDYVQGATERSGTITLTTGKKAITVTYLQQNGGQTLEVRYEGPGVSKQLIPNFKLFTNPPAGWTNIPPVAYAGNDSTLLLPANSITLNANAIDGDGTVNSYAWAKLSGPTATLSGVGSATLNLSNLNVGAYSLKLTVTDNNGAVGTDTVLVTVVSPTNGVNYAYYEGNYSALPNFATQTIRKSGILKGYSLTPRARETQYAFKFDGFIDILTAGQYTFFTTSDDGSKLYIDGVQIVNNDFLQGPTERSGNVTLAVGKRAISVTFFQSGGGQALEVRYQGPGLVKQLIPNYALYYTTSGTNQNPVANAGLDQAITLPTNSKTFVGSGTDSDGTIASYGWTQISGPSTATLTGATTSSLTAGSLIAGTYVFRLTVTDNIGATGTDDVSIVVTSGANQLPVANAGADKTVNISGNSVSFNGSATDADGTISSFAWTQISGPSQLSLTGASTANLSVSTSTNSVGTYVFRLTATDNNGGKGTDDVTLILKFAPPSPYAGADKTITLPTNSALFPETNTPQPPNGSGPVATIAWTQLSGPSTATLTNAATRRVTVSNAVAGTYTFRLTITDSTGQVGSDDVILTVLPAGNQSPVANAGPDQSITLPVNTKTFTGSGTDADGTIASYTWTQISGPSTATLSGAATASLTASALVAGTYRFQLKVTDNASATGIDTVMLLVSPAANQKPIANAGPDQSITLPVNSKTFAGSGTDADGTVTAYAWSQISGPSVATLSGATTATLTASSVIAGTYRFQFKVTDNASATGIDTVLLVVSPAANQKPIANAGPDQSITLPVNSKTFAGSGTDADGTVTAYAWSQISGPSVATLSGATTTNLTASSVIAGTYRFQLQVTDNASATGLDTVSLVVNQAASGNAGTNFSYYEGYFTNLPDFNTLTPKKTGTIANYSLTPRDLEIQYAFKFEGYIDIQTAGQYTFYTTSDDGSKLYIDGVEIVNNDFLQGPTERSGTVSLSTGKKAITVAFFQLGGGAFLEVDYEGPGVSKQAIPSSVLYLNQSGAGNIAPTVNAGADVTLTLPANSRVLTAVAADADGTIASYSWTKQSGPSATLAGANTQSLSLTNLVPGTYVFRVSVTDNNGAGAFDDVIVKVNATNNGINYTYYEGYYTNLPNFASTPVVKSGSVSNFSLVPRNTEIQYAFRFDGYIDIPASGQYTFYTTSDDGSKLYIDGVEIVNNDYLQGPTERSGTVVLTSGKKAITVAFFQLGGGAALEVRYEGPGLTKQLIPDNALFINQSAARMGSGNEMVSTINAIASPNPAKDQVAVRFSDVLDDASYSVVDVLGRVYGEGKITNTSEINISLHDHYMPPGIYFIKISSGDAAIQILKITKE